MSTRIVVLLAAAVLQVYSVAFRVAISSSQVEPFSEPFDDFYADEPSERAPASGSQEDNLMATGLRLGETRGDSDRPRKTRPKKAAPWTPPPRNGSFPFAGPMPSQHWDNRLLIVPNKKFAFCYIEKNACTQFNLLVNGMNGMPIKDKIPFWKSNSDGVYKDYFNNHTISHADGWNMGIFVREPAERFLSAWLSKCDVWEYGGIDCLGPRITDLPMSKKVELFEKMVVELLPKYMAKSRESGGFNAHYDPQHMFCGGRNMSDYSFVGILAGSPASIHRQVKHMLEVHAHVPLKTYRMQKSSDLFPHRAKAGHGTDTVSLMKKFYHNRTILKLVMKQYAGDYAWVGPKVREAWAQSRRAVYSGVPGSDSVPPTATVPPQAAIPQTPRAAPQAAPLAASGVAPPPGLPGIPLSGSPPGAAPAPAPQRMTRKERAIQERNMKRHSPR